MPASRGGDAANWARLAAIIVGSGVVSSLTDWFFAGDWLHRRYTYPEVWRQNAEQGIQKFVADYESSLRKSA